MAVGDLTLVYFGRSYTFTFSGSAITPFTQVFAVDDIVRFTTTGTLPTGLALNTSYYVVSVGATITVSATQGGSAISVNGNFIDTGISFEDPQQYNIQAKVSIADSLKLSAMWSTANNIRREAQTLTGSPYLELTDEITLYFEEGKTSSTKTRSSVGIPFQRNGGVNYYPRLQVKMPIEPTFSPDTGVGNVMAVFELQETGVKI
jgi:hypothetical protein